MELPERLKNAFDGLVEHRGRTGVSIVVGAVLATIATIVIVNFNGRGNELVDLFPGQEFSASEIAQMQLALGIAGLNEYSIADQQIQVPLKKRAEYLQAISENDAIPACVRDFCDEPDSNSLLPFRSDRQQQRLAKKKQVIRRMLVNLNFVERAWIEFDESKTGDPFAPPKRTAVVAISAVDNQHLDSAKILLIGKNVCAAMADLDPSNVVVTDSNADRSYSLAEQSLWAEETDRLVYKVSIERLLREMIRKSLANLHGIEFSVAAAVQPVSRTASRCCATPGAAPNETQWTAAESASLTAGANQPVTIDFAARNGSVAMGNELNQFQLSGNRREIVGSSDSNLQATWFDVQNVQVVVDVPERLVRDLLQRSTAPASGIGAFNMESSLEQLTQEIEQRIRTVAKSSTHLENDDLHVSVGMSLDPNLAAGTNRTPVARFVAWTTRNWKSLALVVFGLTAVWLLRGRNRTAATDYLPNPIDDACGDSQITINREASSEPLQSHDGLVLDNELRIEDLAKLSIPSLDLIISQLARRDLVVALSSASTMCRNCVLARFEADDRGEIEKQVLSLGEISPQAVMHAQNNVKHVMLKLFENNQIHWRAAHGSSAA